MKKNITAVILACVLALSGCTKSPLPELPGDAIAFEMGTFIDDKHDAASFGTIEYNGRTYIAYGTTNNKYKQSYIESCIGYIIQDEHSSSATDLNNTDRRIYTLSGDSEHNFLMEYDDTVKLMNQPSFFRAIDTNGKDIDIPDYIDPLRYEFWGEP
ncbi:MAG: hypothetical protein IKP88_15170 [Lachnospiraceae bacterium]|nr:hypothetical protein [Lachnospiraceae bacterium]